MGGPQSTRLVKTALRCYPARWRRRHGEEATELAALLIRDGIPAASIAMSYLAGATREWLTPRPGQRRSLSAVACALLVAACSVWLLASTVPARAASTIQPSSTIQPHCRLTRSAAVPDVASAPPNQQLIIEEAWHGRPC
jgi:hypothetical protein